ncbi:Protein CBG00980 [Caenorhabditis briggsae]|uniref:Uncharacterized protein n=3 Tax=Caenorhabditis briggsae TaxID=6238 RepID=A0AAE9DFZ9_CAEBR|nr:Protein CBG00980 [Caenorhabditis briggsae]ULU03673.1 hypothetical protein L3Y34_016868 [Caenorhabditis briggsae]CAP22273.1 Protein CBG00980 [Caenorhabditis briggsae]
MQLDSSRPNRRPEKHQHQVQKPREISNRSLMTYKFERLLTSKLHSLEDTLRTIESSIDCAVQERVAEAVQNLMESDMIQNMIDRRVQAILAESTTPPATPVSPTQTISTRSTLASDSEETISCASSTSADEEVASCSGLSDPIPTQSAPHYPNKWEFISCLHPGEVTNFKLEQFTDPVRTSLKMTSDQDIFPRMSLEEMIERDHPTTSDSKMFDEKKISCRNRTQGKHLTDEEFFCLAPCCSDMRLYQAASCPFLPAFVRNRLNKSEDCKVIVQRTANGIELITPIKWQLVTPVIPDQKTMPPDVPEEEDVESIEEEDPLSNRDVVEQLMHEYFIPTPHLPLDDIVFGPYLQRVRESDAVPKNLLRDLVRRVNSNLDSSYRSHHELELFAELDKVPIDEKYGRLPFMPMGN